MKNSTIGVILIVIGLVAFLSAIGLDINICGLALAIIFLWFGIRLLYFNTEGAASSGKQRAFVIPSDDTRRVNVTVKHGMGELRIGPNTTSNDLIDGRCTDEVEPVAERRDDVVNVHIGTSENAWTTLLLPWRWHPLNWNLNLTPHLPTELAVETGMSNAEIDLSQLKIEKLDIESGMGQVEVTLPASAGFTDAVAEIGMGAMTLHIPPGVAARVLVKDSFGGFEIDERRFHKVRDNLYQSPDYDSAANKLDLQVKYGMGSIEIH